MSASAAEVEQPTLDLGLGVEPIRPVPDHALPEDPTIQDRFEAFHNANPWVLAAMERLTADYLAKGHRRVGVKMLTEVLRWQYGRYSVRTTEPFKLSNDFTSRYARLMLDRHPEWEGVIAVRPLRAA